MKITQNKKQFKKNNKQMHNKNLKKLQIRKNWNKKNKVKMQNKMQNSQLNYLYKNQNLHYKKNDINDILGKAEFVKKENKDKRSEKLENFEIKKLLGRGAYGKVMLVEHRVTKKLYAMKSIRKDIAIEKDQLENIKYERKILELINSPFLVGMEYAFQTSEKLYFILTYKSGGEIFFHLSKLRRFGESRTKFYVAEILLAMEYMHSLNIAYRDLKPENVMIDDDGHIAITDFGLAKKMESKDELIDEIAGTPEYFCPEMIKDEPYSPFMFDWWTLGIITYEMLIGMPPFVHKHEEKLLKMIETSEVNFPQMVTISPKAQDFILQLLNKDPKKRLGANGANEIKSHPWFGTMSWVLLGEKKVKPQFIPQKAENAEELKYVDDEFKNQEIVNSVIPEKMIEIVKKHQNEFKNFEFKK
eukprot:TRINITY_DN1650_c0_g1_i11.p1 TRINITY_DN1650_c0_g1~~TRINITY_DN1650_c0_g1_i11.p1  ORF type:complete len:415 (+),score=77.47 TRINITY_DN1650_c0_g1_i11:1804-3048(+)